MVDKRIDQIKEDHWKKLSEELLQNFIFSTDCRYFGFNSRRNRKLFKITIIEQEVQFEFLVF